MPLLSRPAQKGLDRLTAVDRARALEIIASLDTDPSMGKRPQGRLSGCRSMKGQLTPPKHECDLGRRAVGAVAFEGCAAPVDAVLVRVQCPL